MARTPLRDLGGLMGTKALIPIPADMSPAEQQCFAFLVPKDSEWLGMFWGALYQLTAWNSYQRDGLQSGKAMAAAWSAIIEAARTGPCAEAPYCASWDFRTGDPGDGWSGVEVTHGGGLPSYTGTAWSLSGASDSNFNLFNTIKLTTVDPIRVNFARICWSASLADHSSETLGLLVEHVDAGGNSANQVQTPHHGLTWDGCDDTSSGDFYGTEHFIQVQDIWDGTGSSVAGILSIVGVDLFGSGPPPPGATIC